MKGLRKKSKLTGIVLSAIAISSLSGCGIFWGRYTPSSRVQPGVGYSGDCKNPECPGHGGSSDRCLKSFKDLMRYPFR